MAEADITIDLDGAELQANLDALEGRLTNPKAAVDQIKTNFSRQIQANFLMGGDPEWPELSKDSLRKRKGNRTTGPLIDTGRLLLAAIATDPGVFGSDFSQSDSGFTIGVDPLERPDVWGHVFGRVVAKVDGTIGGEPARPFMPNETQIERLLSSSDEILSNYLVPHFG